MKLHEITNIKSAGNKTNLTGGKLPNAYTDNVDSVSKLPRTKKKDMYGTNAPAEGGSSNGSGDGGAGSGGAGSGGAGE